MAKPPLQSILLILAVLTLPGVPAFARIAVVETKDGRTLEGEMVRESAETVVLKIAGIDASIPQDQVANITFRETDQEYFDSQRAELEDDDLDGRLKLATEMLRRDAIGIAQTELAALDRKFPNNPRITAQMQVVEARRSLKSGGELNPNRTPPTGENETGNADGTPGRIGADAYLSTEQMNLIKVYEVDLDSTPRITIPAATLDTFFDTYSGQVGVPTDERSRRAFKRLPERQQLEALFDKQARELYGQVSIRPDPAPIIEFRRRVNPRYVAEYLVPMFGNGKVPGLNLLVSRPQNVEEAYTNFYLLTQMKFDGIPMIDRANPDKSLMLQWGLPRDQVEHRAPEVDGWRPRFRSTADPAYTDIRNWIESLPFTDHPNYNIQYTPPGAEGGDDGGTAAP